MRQLFIEAVIPQANLINLNLGIGINCYEHDASIYVLVNVEAVGTISEQLKESIAQNLTSFTKPIFYVSMFKRKLDFSSTHEIAWGSYVWFADAPKHYIHFEDHPSKINLINKK